MNPPYGALIREERPGDIPGVREINRLAFDRDDEAELVDRIRQNCGDTLSLVAVEDGQIVGHILFSPVSIAGKGDSMNGMGLGPMAVLPTFQGKGIGTALARAGIEALKSRGCPFIVVLGHPWFYPRFGFETARGYEIRAQWDVPDEVFMIMILDDKKMAGVTGVARYLPEFESET